MFRIVEDAILITIAILTVAAVIFELIVVFDKQTVGLADLLLMFIYAEVFGMVAVYFKSHEIPVIYPLFIAITALARLIVTNRMTNLLCLQHLQQDYLYLHQRHLWRCRVLISYLCRQIMPLHNLIVIRSLYILPKKRQLLQSRPL